VDSIVLLPLAATAWATRFLIGSAPGWGTSDGTTSDGIGTSDGTSPVTPRLTIEATVLKYGTIPTG
jgi:hypothetical protein